jgi:hypothetical protein
VTHLPPLAGHRVLKPELKQLFLVLAIPFFWRVLSFLLYLCLAVYEGDGCTCMATTIETIIKEKANRVKVIK